MSSRSWIFALGVCLGLCLILFFPFPIGVVYAEDGIEPSPVEITGTETTTENVDSGEYLTVQDTTLEIDEYDEEVLTGFPAEQEIDLSLTGTSDNLNEAAPPEDTLVEGDSTAEDEITQPDQPEGTTEETSDSTGPVDETAADTEDNAEEEDSTTEPGEGDLPEEQITGQEDITPSTELLPGNENQEIIEQNSSNVLPEGEVSGTPLDPWYYTAGPAQQSFTTFQGAIDALKAGNVIPLNGIVYVESGTITENLVIDGFSYSNPLNLPLIFNGGCNPSTGNPLTDTCTSTTTLNGTLTIKNSLIEFIFNDFDFLSTINLENGVDVTLNGTSANQTYDVTTSGTQTIRVEINGGGGTDVVDLTGHAFDQVNFKVGTLANDDIRGSFTMQASTTDRLDLILNDISILDLDIDAAEFTYEFDRTLKSYTLRDHATEANRMVLASSDFGDLYFNNPSTALTVKTIAMNADLTIESFDNPFAASLSLLAESSFSNITVNTDLLISGFDLTIQGWKVTVAAGKILSTRAISGTDYEADISTGDSGNISILPVKLTLESGVKILAHAETPYLGGIIEIRAENTSGWNVDALDWIREHLFPLIGTSQGVYVNSAEIKISDAVIKGDVISISAEGGYVMDYTLLEELFDILNGNPVGEFIESLTGSLPSAYMEKVSDLGILQRGLIPIPIGVNIRIGYAEVELNGSTLIEAVNDIAITAQSYADSGIDIKSKYFAWALGVGVGIAKVSINDSTSITSTGGNILIQSNGSNDAAVSAAAYPYVEQNKIPLSIAIGVSVLKSHAIAGQNTTLSAGGSVNVIANGENIGGSSAEMIISGGGNAAIALAIYVGISDILAQVNGQVTAGSTTDIKTITPIDLNNININANFTNSIYIQNHGFQTGDMVTYHAQELSKEIKGLQDGESYMVVVLDDHYIRLMSAEPLNISNTGVRDGAIHSLTPFATITFLPDQVVDINNDLFTITDHGFTEDQTVYYSSMQEEIIGGLTDVAEYQVRKLSDHTFSLLSEGLVVDLTSAPATAEQSFSFIDYVNQVTFDASDDAVIDTGADIFTISNHGFETGDMVFYEIEDGDFSYNYQKNYGFEANTNGIDAATDTIKLAFGDGLEVGDIVLYNQEDATLISGLISGTEYQVISKVNCTSTVDGPEQLCAYIQLALVGDTAAIDLGSVTDDPINTGGTQYTPVGLLILDVVNNQAPDIALRGLQDQTFYYIARIDDDHFRLAASLDEAEELVEGIEISVGTLTTGDHWLDSGLTNGIGVRANLDSEECSYSGSWIGSEKSALDLLKHSISHKATTAVKSSAVKIWDFIKMHLTDASSKSPDDQSKDQLNKTSKSSSFNVTGSLAVTVSINSVKAQVGENAVLNSAKDIAVIASQTDTWQSQVESDATSTDESGGETASIGAGLSVSVLINNVDAEVGNGAVLDAARDLTVDASITYPFLAQAYITTLIRATLSDIAGEIFDIAGSFDAGIFGNMLNSYVRTTANAAKDGSTTVAGSINILVLYSDVNAQVGDNVHINQTEQNDDQNVTVSAKTEAKFLNITGTFNFMLQPGLARDKKIESIKKYFKELPGSAFTPFGSGDGKNGMGGGLDVRVMIFNTHAVIGNGVRMHIGDNGKLSVDANTRIVNFSLVQGGSKAKEGFGIAGSISYVGIFSDTLARIGSTAQISGGAVDVKAVDDTLNINLAGSIAVGGNVGVGITLAVNTLIRNVQAIVGNLEEAAGGPWQVDFNNLGDQSSALSVEVFPRFDGSGVVTTLTDGAENTYEVQWIETNATQGQFTLWYLTDESAPLNYNATASEVETALNALTSISAIGGVVVSGGEGAPWEVTFNTLGKKDWITGEAYSNFYGQLDTESVDGDSGLNEVQTIKNDATGNDLTFTYSGGSTAALAYDIDAASLQSALNALQSITDVGGVTVYQPSIDTWMIVFDTTGDKDLITATFVAEVTSNIYIEGALDAHELQQLVIEDASQGTYELHLNNERTLPLFWDASDVDIEAALNALPSIIDAGGVTVTTGVEGFEILFGGLTNVDTIEFFGLRTFQDTPTVEATDGTGSTAESIAILHSSRGGAFRLLFGTDTTWLLPYDATSDQVAAALNALPSVIAAGGVSVSGLSGNANYPYISLSNDLTVTADADGYNWAFSLAAAVTRDEKKPSSTSTSQTKGSGMPRAHWKETLLVKMGLAGQNFPKSGSTSTTKTQQGAKNSFALAGDISVNIGIDKVEAAIRDAGYILARNFKVLADNASGIRAAAGSAAINTNGSAQSIGIAGSVTFNWLEGVTRAIIQNVCLKQLNPSPDDPLDVEVKATRSGDIFALAAGGAGAPKEKGIAIAGSVAVNIVRNITESILEGLHDFSSSYGGINIHADEDASILAIAGALGYGGQAGVGAAFAVNLIMNETRALVQDSSFIHKGLLSAISTSNSRIISVGGAVGASKGKVGVGGTIAVNIILTTLETLLDNVETDYDDYLLGAGEVKAENESNIYSGAGALGIGKTAGIGAAISFNYIDPHIRAVITNSRMYIGTIEPALLNTQGLTLLARNSSSIDTVTAGGAGADKVAVAGAVSVNLILTTVEAGIGPDTSITSAGDITVTAEDDSAIHAFSGNIAGAGKVAVGASIGFNWMGTTVQTFITDAVVKSINGDILIKSLSTGEMIAIAAGGQGAGTVAVGGSVVIGYIGNNIKSFINDYATVTAQGNVGVTAEDKFSSILIAGVVGGAGQVAVGISNTTLVTNNLVEANISGNSKVKGRGKKGTVPVYTGSITTAGAWQQVNMRGVWVTAISSHAIRNFAVGGVGAGTVAVAGSGSVSVITDTVQAFVDDTSSVNEDNSDAEDDPSGPHQSVNIFAGGETIIWGVAGALAGAGTVGVGAGLDIGVLNKTVEAYIAGTVNAVGDVLVQAISHEQVISVSASLGAAGTVGVAGSVGVYTLNIDTSAYIASTADVFAEGSVLVNAVDKTDVILIAGSISGAGTVGVGGSFDVSVTSKNVLAFIEGGAEVDALGNGDGVTAFSGSFTETWTEDPHNFITSITNNTLEFSNPHGLQTGDEVIYTNGTDDNDVSILTAGGDPLENGGNYYAIYVSDNQIKLAATKDDALAGNFISLNSDLGGLDTHEISKSNVVYVEPLTFDPATAVQSDDSIELGYEHGYTTGQALTYSSGGDVPILGLEDGATYYAIVDDGNPTRLKLALDKLNALGGSALDIEVGSASGDTHSLWDGQIGNFSPDVKMPGPQFKNDLNNDGDDDTDGNQDALTKKRAADPDPITVNGVVISALNQDLSVTVAVSGGGAGTVAVNISGLVNVMKVNVLSFIGDGAMVNEWIFNQQTLLDPNAAQSVYVLAGNDYYHIGIAAVGNGAGTVSVTPDADITVTVNDVRAFIADNAEVYAQQDVIVSAEVNGLIVSVSVGITGSGLVSVAGSISVISINNSTLASIGENDDDADGATVYANGNVMVNAYDAMQVILVSGSLGLGFGAVGVGASIGVLVEVKQTGAFIAPYSIVDGKGNGTSLINVYSKDMNTDGTFALETAISGVVVQAYSKDNIITVAGSGAFGFYTGVAGAVMVDVFKSDTFAWIGAGAQVNQDRTGVSSLQDVVVNSLNYSKIFNFAGSVGAGIVGIGGAIQVNIIRNNAKAFIGDGADVTAERNVTISALNNKDVVVVAAAIGVGVGGFGLSILVNVVGSEFTTRYTVTYDESNRDENGDTTGDQYQETIDEDPLALNEQNQSQTGNDNLNGTLGSATDTNNTMGDQLVLYDGSNKNGNDPNSFDNNELSGDVNADTQTELGGLDLNTSLFNAMSASGDDSRSGTVAYIGVGAVVTAVTGDININAVERVNFVGVAGTLTVGGSAFGAAVSINVVGSNVEAYVQRQAELTAGNDINITAKLITDMQGHAIAGNLSGGQSVGAQVLVFIDNGSQRASLGEDTEISGDAVIIESARNILVKASAERTVIADASGLNAALGGAAFGISVAVSVVNGQTVAYIGMVRIGKTTGKSVNSLSVEAVNDILSSEVWTVSLSVGGVALGAAVSINTTSPTTISYIAPGADIKTLSYINVKAISRANAFARVIAANLGGFAGGVNVAVTVLTPDVEAYIDSNATARTTLYTDYVNVITIYNYDDAGTNQVLQGAKAESYGASGGIGALQGNIAVARGVATVRTFIYDGADVTGRYQLAMNSLVYNQAEAYAYGAAVGGGAVTINLALATTEGSTYYLFINNAETLSHTHSMNNIVTERDYAEIYAGSIGLVSGTVNVAVALQSPQVKTYIMGPDADVLSSSDMAITAQFNADAGTKAFGITVSYLVTLGASVGVSKSNPTVEAAVLDGRVRAVDIMWIEARQNTNNDASRVDSGVYAYTNASGGGALAGNGAVSIASITPTVTAYTHPDAVIAVGNTLAIHALAYNKSHAEAWGVTVSVAGVGASVARSTSQGTTQAYLGGDLVLKDTNGDIYGAAANNLTIKAETVDDAYAYSLLGIGGIIAGGGSSAKAYANSTTQAYIPDNLTVFALGTITVRAVGTPQSYAKSDGVAAGGLAVGVSEALADSSPTIEAWVGSGVTLYSGAQMIGTPVLTFTDNSNSVYLLASAYSTGDLTLHAGDPNVVDDFDSITRATGSWTTDGFLSGYLVKMAEPFGGIFAITLARIQSISANGLTLVLTSQGLLESKTITSAVVDMISDPFHEITRDTGDWYYEGFRAGQEIAIGDTSKNNRTVTIAGVSTNGKTLFVSITQPIINESSVSGASVKKIKDAGGNLVVEAHQALPADGSHSAYSESNASGGALIGVNASNSDATRDTTLQAYLRANGVYSMTGDLELRAETSSSQYAIASGKFGGIIAVGHNPANASSNSNTYATVSDGVQISADTVWVVASGEDRNYAESVSGMGGVVSIQAAAHAETSTISDTVAQLLNNVSMNVGSVKLESIHQATFNSKTDSINASLVGYSGASATNTEESTVLVDFGNAHLTAANFYANAENNTTKDWLPNDEYNVTSGSGGLLDLPAARSETTISKDTDIKVQDGAVLTQTGSQFTPGEFIFTINHNITAYDKTKLDAGGAIAIAKAVSKVTAEHDVARITIGSSSGTQIDAVGDVFFVILENATIKTLAHAKTYGLAGVAQGESLSRMTPTHEIVFNTGADFETKGNVHLYVGEDNDFHMNRYTLEANTELWNWTGIPINIMDGSAELEQVNKVIINSGAVLGLGRNAYMRAKAGFVDLFGHSKGTDSYSAGAGALIGDETAFETNKSSKVEEEDNGVIIDGSVYTGNQRSQEIIITGSITFNAGSDPVVVVNVTNSSGSILIGYTGGWESIATNIQDELDRLEELKAVYNGNTIAVEAYQSQIDFIIAGLIEQGISVETQSYIGDDGTTHYSYLVDSSIVAYFITIDEAWAQAGEIYVDSDYLIGQGVLDAPPNATITIQNSGPFYIRTNQLTIPSEIGGRIVFNDVAVSKTDLIDKVPLEMQALVLFSSFSDPTSTSPAPQITVENLYAPGSGTNHPSEEMPTDLLITGDITNIRGGVTITNTYGSVMMVLKPDGISSASIDAGTVTISSGRDFVQGYTDKFVHTGSNPADLWADIINSYRTACAILNSCYGYSELDREGTGQIIAGNRVYISARYLNINGLIQSGRPVKSITLDTQAQTDIVNAITYYNLNKTKPNIATRVQIYSDANFIVYFNLVENRIEVSNVRVEGGYVELHGTVINTGGGEIKALAGYGSISVTNNTGYDIMFNMLDTGRGVDGKIIIYDSNYTTTQLNNGVSSTRTKAVMYLSPAGSNQILVYTNENTNFEFVQLSGSAGTISGRTTTYDPKPTQFYSWMTGQRTSTLLVETYGSSSFWGCDWCVKDPGDLISRTTTLLDKVPLLEEGSNFIQLASPGATVNFDFTKTTITLSQSKTKREWTDSSGWWIFKTTTYYTQYTTETGQKMFNQMRVRADFPIDLEFIGRIGGGLITLTSNGNIILNGSLGNSGDQNGTVNISSDKSVWQTGGKIYARDLTIGAEMGIGSLIMPIVTDMRPGGSLSATTTTGDIYIQETLNDLVIDQVTTGKGKVVMVVDGSLLGLDATNLIKANQMELHSTYGTIGTSATPVRLEFVPATMLVNSQTVPDPFHDYISATAPDDIFLTTINGDMPVRLIQSFGGNVTVVVTDGDLLDRNFTQELDTRTFDELKALWDAMNLTGSAAEAALAEALAAYIGSRESEYETYWKYRNMQADPSVYDPAFVVPVSQDEKDLYLSQLGSSTEVQAIVDTLSVKRTDEYHALHRIYGVLSNTYVSGWSYAASSAYEPSFSNADVDSNNDTIQLGTHIFRDKQAVSLVCDAGSSISGLVCSSTSSIDQPIYYIKLDATILGLIKLAASLDDWTNDTFVDLGTASGTFQLSEIVAISSGYKWTENQLRYTLNAGWLKETADTQTAIEEANIIAQGTLSISTSNGNIGSDEGVQVIDLSGGLYTLSDAERVLLASTERRDAVIIDDLNDIIALGIAHNLSAGDVVSLPGIWNLDPATIPGLGGQSVYYAILVYDGTIPDPYAFKLASTYANAMAATPLVVNLTQKQIRINLKSDFNVEATGALTAVASGFAYIGSEEDILASDIETGEELRLKTGKGIYRDPAATSAVISGCLTSTADCSVILEAGGGSIGESTNPVTTNVLYPNGSLIARARDAIYINQLNGNLRIDVVYAPNLVSIEASAGSLLDAFADENLNIKTGELILNASADVGASDNMLEIDLPTNSPLTLTNVQNVYLYEIIGNMTVNHVEAVYTVSLKAQMSILDYLPDGYTPQQQVAPKIICDTLLLESVSLGIGSHANELHVNTHVSGTGTLSAIGGSGDVLINEMDGDLYIDSIDMTKGGVAYIFSVGSIYNGHPAGDPTSNVIGDGYVRLYASHGIGTLTHPLRSAIGYLQGYANNGSSYLTNSGLLHVGWDNNPEGFTGNGDIIFQASSPLMVIQNVSANGDLTLVANDSVNPGDDLTITNGKWVTSLGGHVYLYAGDNFYMQPDSWINAFANIYIFLDYNNTDPGTNLDPEGSVLVVENPNMLAQGLYIYGNTQDDSVTLNSALIMAYLEIQMGSGDDTLTLLNDLQVPVSRLYLDDGDDLFVLNTIGDYAYDMLVSGGSGSDLFRPIATNTNITINGDAGDDFYELYFTIPYVLTLNGGDDADIFDFADGIVLNGTIDGGPGSDKIDLMKCTTTQIAVLSATSTDGFAGTVSTAVPGGFTNIDQLFASVTVLDDTLYGLDAVALWDVDGLNSLYTVGANTLAFAGFDYLHGGSDFDTFVLHGAETAMIYGHDGDDRFALLDGASLNGTIFGGEGSDLLDYGDYSTPVHVDLRINLATNITLIDSIQNVAGGSADDLIYGNHEVNRLMGNGGTDTLYGLGNTDYLYGGTGDDELYGGTGDDHYMYEVDFGNDHVYENRNEGVDSFDFSENAAGLVIDINADTVAVGLNTFFHADNHVELVQGGTGDDTFRVNEPRRISLLGGEGDDTFSFFDNIQLTGTVDGQTGHDTFDLSALTTSRDVTLTGLGTVDGFKGTESAIIGSFDNIDNILGSNLATDTLTGMNAAALFDLDGTDRYISGNTLDFLGFEVLNGGSGEDTFQITGTSTYDLLYGGKGNDRFAFSDNAIFNGVIDGGSGINTLDYSDYTTSRAFYLVGYHNASSFIGEEASINGNFVNIYHITGSSADDSLYGMDEGGVFTFTQSSMTYRSKNRWLTFESLENLFGSDTKGDTFTFMNGATFGGNLDGRGGSDTANLTAYRTDILADLSQNFLSTVLGGFFNMENVFGGYGDDTLIGNDERNKLDGDGGDDILYGLGGNDILISGSGINYLYGGDGDDIFHTGKYINYIYGGDGRDTAYVWRSAYYHFPLGDVEIIIFYPEPSDLYYYRVIDVISAQQEELLGDGNPRCIGVILRLPNGDQVVFGLGYGYIASLHVLAESELPGALPQGMQFLNAIRLDLLYGDKLLKTSWLIHKLSFVVPEGYEPGDMAVLFWDEGLAEWVPQQAMLKPDEWVESGMRIETATQRTGVYVLVIRT